MTIPDEPLEFPWSIEQTSQQLRLTHDHRWLKIIGLPMVLFGLAGATGIWLIPDIPMQEAWPMLAVGSLIGCGFAIMGLHLSFNLLVFTADRQAGTLVRREGFGPFIRIRTMPLKEIQSVALLQGPSGGSLPSYILEVRWENRRLRIVSLADKALVEHEAIRWAAFLNVDLQDCTEKRLEQLAR